MKSACFHRRLEEIVLSPEDKKRIIAQAAEYMKAIQSDGDWTEALAGLYAAAQVIEREMQIQGQAPGEWIREIELVGRRVGTTIMVELEIDFVGNRDVQ
jgi:hypothetical protein